LKSHRIYSLTSNIFEKENSTRTSDRVEAELIKMIIFLELNPGSMVNENDLRKKLKCGRTPIREALLRLAQENLIISIPRKGMVVAELDLMNYVKLIEALGSLASVSAYMAVEKCTNDEIEELERITQSIKENHQKKNFQTVTELDFEFHIRIAEFARNDYFVSLLARLYRLNSRYFYIGLKNGLDITTSTDEHLRIIRGFRRRESEEVRNLMYLHISDAKDRIAATMLDVGRPVFPAQNLINSDAEINTIRIGVPTMMTGPGAPMGADIIAGISLAVESVNQKGGLLGKKLEIVYADIKDTNPLDSRQGAELLVNSKVHAFFPGGFYNPSCVIEFAKYKQPLLHASAVKETVDPIAANLFEFGNVIQMCASEEDLGPNAFNNLINLPYVYPNNKVAILGSDISYDRRLQKGIVRQAQYFNWEIILNDSYQFGSTRFDSQLTRIKDENPAIIIGCITSTESAIEFVNQFLLDPTPSLIFLHWSPVASKFIHSLGEKANGILWQTEFGYLPTKNNTEWILKFSNEFGREPGVAWPAMMDDMLHIWINAVNFVGDPTKYDEVINHIRSLNDHPYVGRTGRFGIDPTRNEGLSGSEWLPIHTYQIQNQKNVLLYLENEFFTGNDNTPSGKFIEPPWIRHFSFHRKNS